MSEENKNNDFNIHSVQVDDLYKEWFLDYASYVILERAVPNIEDGLKPVQRRILHAMKDMDDGRFHKVANIIGQTMQYHPHGDASIGDALVNIGQKDLMIDCQGNWGDNRTGDRAAAPRYIEARLSKFALEVAFNGDITQWQLSYDGRKKEPITLPIKFPLLLTQGVEGIAVGLSTKILPHNFCELIEASIQVLKGHKTNLLPDFPTGGYVDVSNYNAGERGGRIRVRAKIEVKDKSTILIKEIPFGVTTNTLIDSIVKASEKGKIKIKKVVDNTAKNVEIEIELPPGISPDVTVDALYAFTDCESSISPNCCVIIDNKPRFITVDELLKLSTNATKELLKKELEINLHDLEESWHFSSLEKIFIEKRIYRDIEEEETWEGVIKAIDKGLSKYKKLFKREITEEDIVKLTEIRIKRISKFDAKKADEAINKLEEEIASTQDNLNNLTKYAIKYFENLLKKYGKGRERKTEIKIFDTIEVKAVAVANKKLYVNRVEGFVGMGLKNDELIGNCSDIDDVIVFMRSGKMMVSKVGDKKFFGKDILHADVWKKEEDRRIYHMIYTDGKSKKSFVKRFAVTAITRDKEYDLTTGEAGSKVMYFSTQPNSENETVTIHLHPASAAKNKVFEFSFGELAVKGRQSQGNVITKYPIKKVDFKTKGQSTLGGVDIWFDEIVGRLNKDSRGKHLGTFDTDNKILVLNKNGEYELTNFELTNRYEPENIIEIQKYNPLLVISAVYYDGSSKNIYVKRFKIEASQEGKKYKYITEHNDSKLLILSIKKNPKIEYTILKGKTKDKELEQVSINDLIEVKGWKALGNKLTYFPIKGDIKDITPEDAPEDTEYIDIGTTIEFDLDGGSEDTGEQKELFD
jgi:topoisomerase-4 subunit A